MKWDDELGALARKAIEVFGVDVVADAYARALSSAHAVSLDQIPETILDLIAAAPEDVETTKVVRGIDAAAALKLELQRLLTAH
jgi:hypothetical protein